VYDTDLLRAFGLRAASSENVVDGGVEIEDDRLDTREWLSEAVGDGLGGV